MSKPEWTQYDQDHVSVTHGTNTYLWNEKTSTISWLHNGRKYDRKYTITGRSTGTPSSHQANLWKMFWLERRIDQFPIKAGYVVWRDGREYYLGTTSIDHMKDVYQDYCNDTQQHMSRVNLEMRIPTQQQIDDEIKWMDVENYSEWIKQLAVQVIQRGT